MTPVLQTIISRGDGDCQRAAVASILDLTIEQVPHFLRFGEEWCEIYIKFMFWNGWDYYGTCSINADRGLLYEDSIEGYFIASVPSLTFENVFHAVILDVNGDCIHDPNPNHKWNGLNIYKDILPRKDHITWSMFKRIEYAS